MQYLIALLILTILIVMIIRKIKHGSSCCGEKEASETRIIPSDENPDNYKYRYLLTVEGMVCVNCVRRVENLFNKTGEMLAKVSLKDKKVQLFCKRELSRKEIAVMLDEAGYTLTEMKEENV